MKKTSLLLVSLLLTLAGCQPTPASSSPSSSSIDSTIQTTKKLTITSLPEKLKYKQYERLNLNGLVVMADTYRGKDLESSTAISDYKITIDGLSLFDGDTLTMEGEVTVLIQKEGFEDVSFQIDIAPRRNLRQSLAITSYPRLSYAPGETFSFDGMVLTLTTIYYDDSRNRITEEETVTDYTYSIDGIEGGSLVLEDIGSYRIDIHYQGLLDELSVSLSPYVLSSGDLSPETFEDDSIVLPNEEETMTVSFDTSSTSEKGYYSPSEVEIPYTLADYSRGNYFHEVKMPSVGKTPLLVVPIIFRGYEYLADGENMELIRKAFFGDSEDVPFESLHSYYYKSSMGQLDITGTVTDYFHAPSEYSFSALNRQKTYNDLAEDALDWVEETYSDSGFNRSDYDSNSDGVIDGLWLISVLPMQSSSHLYSWAFTTSTGELGDPDSPKVNTFGYATTEFLQGEEENESCDSHVLIHETGHMLGLNDYYSFNTKSGYSPLGGCDMMDHNVGDMNPYSKMLLGWTKPYVITGDCQITLPSSQSSDMPLIVFAEDSKEYPVVNGKLQFNIFDEYMVLDLYSGSGLNSAPYSEYDIAMPKGRGGRLYHVDNRLGILQYDNSGDPETLTLPGDPLEPLKEEHQGSIYRAFYNTEAGNNSEESYFIHDKQYNYFDEIRWISADSEDYASSSSIPDSDYLFSPGDVFSMEKYLSQFNSKGLDNGKVLSTTFTILP